MLKVVKLKEEQEKVLFLPAENPIQIKGVAGSGKTTVAIYRAKHLLETYTNLFIKENKVIIFTYNKTLRNYIEELLKVMPGIKGSVGLNIKVTNFHSWAMGYMRSQGFNKYVASNETTDECIRDALNKCREKYGGKKAVLKKKNEFYKDEISWLKGKLITKVNDYLEAKRTGKGTKDRVTQDDKKILFDLYVYFRKIMGRRKMIDYDDFATYSLSYLRKKSFQNPFTHIVVDEAQDLNKAQMTVIKQLVSNKTNSITIIADAAQRIYKSGFVWKEVGIGVAGKRTVELKTNLRNKSTIAAFALSLISNDTDAEDFTKCEKWLKGGKKPKVIRCLEFENQIKSAKAIISDYKDSSPSIVLLHRTWKGVAKINNGLKDYFDLQIIKPSGKSNFESGIISITTMNSIKGLESDCVIIFDVDDKIIPSSAGFNSENDEYHINQERRLLYTACTRARENLTLLVSLKNPSRYIDDIDSSLYIDSKPGSYVVDNDDDDLPF